MANNSLIEKQFPGIAKRAAEAQERITRAQEPNADNADEGVKKSEKAKGHLSPDRHPQQDFFVADILDAAPKDDLASMEHPLFSLKAGDMRVRKYERNGNSIEIKPGFDGCATIHDKDVWIYCISQLGV